MKLINLIFILHYFSFADGGQGSVNVPDGENDIDAILREINSVSVSKPGKKANNAKGKQQKPGTSGKQAASNKQATSNKQSASNKPASTPSAPAPAKKKLDKNEKLVQTDPPSVPVVDLYPDGQLN